MQKMLMRPTECASSQQEAYLTVSGPDDGLATIDRGLTSVPALFSYVLERIKKRLTPPFATEIYIVSNVSLNVNGFHYLVFFMTNECNLSNLRRFSSSPMVTAWKIASENSFVSQGLNLMQSSSTSAAPANSDNSNTPRRSCWHAIYSKETTLNPSRVDEMIQVSEAA